MPPNKSFFTPKERGPIKKRVAPSDSSKNFGLGTVRQRVDITALIGKIGLFGDIDDI